MGKAEVDDAMVMKAVEDQVARLGGGVTTSRLSAVLVWSQDGVMRSLTRLRAAGRIEWHTETDAEGIIVRAEWRLPAGKSGREHERKRRSARTSVFAVQERQEMKPELIAEIKACYLECRNTETVRRRLAVSRSTVLEALRVAGLTPRRIAGPDRMEVRPKRPLPLSISEDDARRIVRAYQELGSIDRAAVETQRSTHTVRKVLDAMGVERRVRQGY